MLLCCSIIICCIYLSCAQIYLLDKIPFDEITTEQISQSTSQQMGWIKMCLCTESKNFLSTFTYYHNNTSFDLHSYAISLKFVPPNSVNNINYTDLAVIAKPCSNPVRALNNHFESSFTWDEQTGLITGPSNLSNWIGTNDAKFRLQNGCQHMINTTMRPWNEYMYHACANSAGIHIIQKESKCVWNNNVLFGQNIEIYFGFDINKQYYCKSDEYVNIEIYSRGKDQPQLFDEMQSFIKVNGNDYPSTGLQRGLSVVVLDQNNPNILIKSKTFDFWGGTATDLECSKWLNAIDPNKIVIIVVEDTVMEYEYITNTTNIINSWGCNINSLEYRESFIFIGKASSNNIPEWSYCMKKLRFSNSSIFKTFQLKTDNSEIIYRQLYNNATLKCVYEDSIFPIMDYTNFYATICNITNDNQKWELGYKNTYYSSEWFKLINKNNLCCIWNIEVTKTHLSKPDGINFGCNACGNLSIQSEYWKVDYVNVNDITFRIRNMETNLCLYQNDDLSRFGVSDCRSYGDQRWRWNILSDSPTISPTIPTNSPITLIPTQFPTTSMPTINIPTNSPITQFPTTSIPTTNIPTTFNPTTSAPSTIIPTTFNPTTSIPSTSMPTTFNPTTSTPTNIPSKMPSLSPMTLQPTQSTQNGEGIVDEIISTVVTVSRKEQITKNENESMDVIFIIIILGIVIIIVVFVIIILGLYLWKRFQKKTYSTPDGRKLESESNDIQMVTKSTDLQNNIIETMSHNSVPGTIDNYNTTLGNDNDNDMNTPQSPSNESVFEPSDNDDETGEELYNDMEQTVVTAGITDQGNNTSTHDITTHDTPDIDQQKTNGYDIDQQLQKQGNVNDTTDGLL